MFALNFKNVGAAEDGIDIQELFKGTGDVTTTPFCASNSLDLADNIMVWSNDGMSGGGYTTYYLYDTTSTKTSLTVKRYHWVNSEGNGIMSNAVITTGKGAWYLHRGTGFTLGIKNQSKK